MIHAIKQRFPRKNDDGAILILAIIVITTVALVVGALLTRGDGSLRATVELRSVASSSYAADAAANVAINNLRTGYGFTAPNAFNNSLDGSGCFGKDGSGNAINTLTLPNFYPKSGSQSAPTSAIVECAGVDGTGMEGSPVPINNSNKPGYAIVTLGGPLTTSDLLRVHGGVYSNTTINGSVALDAGDAWANGACTQTTVVAPATKHCNSGQTLADPNYADDLGGTMPVQGLATLPTSCSSGVAKFDPGYYDNAQTLSAATSMCSVAWFQPGTYYFDFHDETCANVCPDNVFSANDNTWHTGGGTIVGGTPTDANDNTLAQPPASPVLPSACRSPITKVNAVGVQFVFGNNSRMYVDKNARVELCGTYHANRPPIVFFGLKTGSTPAAATANGLNVSSVTTQGLFGATATAGNLAPGGGAATWTTASAAAQSTTMTVQGFPPGTSIPKGSVLTSATLHVRHQDADAVAANSQASATVKIGSNTTGALTVPVSSSLVTSDIAITGANLNLLQTAVHDSGYAGAAAATVAYTAKAKKNNATTTIDFITLDLTYYVPVLRGESGTNLASGTGTPILDMPGGNNKILLYLQGTTYAPLAYFNILLGNFSAEVAKFGIVARQLQFAITNGNPSWTGPIFEIPDNSPGYGYENTSVDLKVHLCPNQATCTTSATTALTSRVQLWDPSGEPAPPGRQITVLSWSHNR